MFAVRRATELVGQARRLIASDGPLDDGTRLAAAATAKQAQELLGTRRDARAMLVAAEATELRAVTGDPYDLESNIAGLVGAASMYIDVGLAEAARRGQARIARRLANEYAKIGMRDRAAAFAAQYLRTLPERDVDLLAMAYTVAVLEVNGEREPLTTFVRQRDSDDYPEPLRSILAVLAQRATARDGTADDVAAAAELLRYVPTDLRVQCELFAANTLVAKGAAAQAVGLLTRLRDGLAVDPIQDARIAYALGAAAARAGDEDLAAHMHLVAWARYNELRYHVGAMCFRRAIDRQLARIRTGALSAAARTADWRLMLELIESSRLQATLDVSGSTAELDQALATGVHEKPAGPSTARVIDPTSMPDVYQVTVEDLFEGRADVADRVCLHVGGTSTLAVVAADDGHAGTARRLDIETVLGRHAAAGDLWWSSWFDSGALYWVLTRGTTPVDGGVVNLQRDEELRAALSIVLLRAGVTPAWPVPARVVDVDLDGYLERADDPDERRLTSTLARLLPDALRTVGDRTGRLFMSVPSELTPVPWPILPVGMPGPRVTRLIERFELRFLPSLAVLDGVRPDSAPAATTDPLPLLLTCDYFPVDGDPGVLPARRAQTVFAARELCDSRAGVHEATTMNLARWLRSLPPNTEGVAFFRAHYEWVEADPGSSGIALADGVFLSGMLGVRDATSGLPILNLPSTVVMSCCSTSGNRERNGGESLGLAPLAMMAGARRLIATSVDIRHTAFTVALDELLIDTAMRPGNHFAALRELQLRLLDAWRGWDHDTADDKGLLPTPEIWANYHAYGV